MKKTVLMALTFLIIGCSNNHNSSTIESSISNISLSNSMISSSNLIDNDEYYLVYKNYNNIEDVYFGYNEHTFSKIFNDTSTFKMCEGGRISTTKSYTCLNISPFDEYSFKINTSFGFDFNLLNIKTASLKYFNTISNLVILDKTTKDYKEFSLSSSILNTLDNSTKNAIVSYNNDFNKFILVNKSYDNYFYNSTINNLTKLPEGFSFYNLDDNFKDFVGFNRSNQEFMILNIENLNTPLIISEAEMAKGIGYKTIAYLKENKINLYNINTNQTTIMNIENSFEVFMNKINMINSSMFIYLNNNTFYIFDINKNVVVSSFENIKNYIIDDIYNRLILIGNEKIVWYSLKNSEVVELNLPYSIDFGYTYPLVTNDILFFPTSSRNEITIFKNHGLQEYNYTKEATIAYVMNDNKIFKSYSDGSSYILTLNGVEEVTWIKEKLK